MPYYHVIEDGGYGNVGSHGCYRRLSDAEKEVQRLSYFFPKSYFYVYESLSKREPVICTI